MDEPVSHQPEDEAEFLAAYDPGAFPRVAVTVDVVLLTVRSGRLSVLLVQRRGHPFRGHWALPGGFVEPDDDLDGAAGR
jgi:8-oxo-dGTP diphosphatase